MFLQTAKVLAWKLLLLHDCTFGSPVCVYWYAHVMQIDFHVVSSFSFFNKYSISKNIRSVGVGVGKSKRKAAIPFLSRISAVCLRGCWESSAKMWCSPDV